MTDSKDKGKSVTPEWADQVATAVGKAARDISFEMFLTQAAFAHGHIDPSNEKGMRVSFIVGHKAMIDMLVRTMEVWSALHGVDMSHKSRDTEELWGDDRRPPSQN